MTLWPRSTELEKARDNEPVNSPLFRLINSFLGKVKVIIAPHDAHALRASNGVRCDVYCELIDGAFLDFYSIHESKSKNWIRCI